MTIMDNLQTYINEYFELVSLFELDYDDDYCKDFLRHEIEKVKEKIKQELLERGDSNV